MIGALFVMGTYNSAISPKCKKEPVAKNPAAFVRFKLSKPQLTVSPGFVRIHESSCEGMRHSDGFNVSRNSQTPYLKP